MANDPRFEVYRQNRERMIDEGEPAHHFAPEYGWRFRAANGQISAVGGEGFTRREDAKRAVADFVLATRQASYGMRFAEAIIDAVLDVES